MNEWKLNMIITLKKSNIELKIFYLMVFLSFLGASVYSISFAGINLLPYRALLFLAIIIIVSQNTFLKSEYTKVKEYLLFFVIWIMYSLLFLNCSLDQTSGIKYIIYLVIYMLMLICYLHYIKNIQQIKNIFKIWHYFLVITIIIAIWEINTGQHLSVSGYNKTPDLIFHIPTTVYGNSNDYATFLAISLPFVLFQVQCQKNIFYKLFFLFISFAIIFLILTIGSRANIVSVGIAFILYVVLSNRKFKIKTFIVLAFITLISIIYFQEILDDIFFMMNNNLISLIDPVERSTNDSNIVRMNLVYNSIDFLSQTYGFGVGAGNAEIWMEKYGLYDTRGITNPHNWWIEILVNYGLFIFVLYVIIYIRLIYQLFEIFLKSKDINQQETAKVLFISLVTFSFASISSSSVMGFMPQWILIILSIVSINIYKQKRETKCIS